MNKIVNYKWLCFHLKKNDEKDQTELEIVDVKDTETSEATTHDNVAKEGLTISEEVLYYKEYHDIYFIWNIGGI